MMHSTVPTYEFSVEVQGTTIPLRAVDEESARSFQGALWLYLGGPTSKWSFVYDVMKTGVASDAVDSFISAASRRFAELAGGAPERIDYVAARASHRGGVIDRMNQRAAIARKTVSWFPWDFVDIGECLVSSIAKRAEFALFLRSLGLWADEYLDEVRVLDTPQNEERYEPILTPARETFRAAGVLMEATDGLYERMALLISFNDLRRLHKSAGLPSPKTKAIAVTGIEKVASRLGVHIKELVGQYAELSEHYHVLPPPGMERNDLFDLRNRARLLAGVFEALDFREHGAHKLFR